MVSAARIQDSRDGRLGRTVLHPALDETCKGVDSANASNQAQLAPLGMTEPGL